mmetsp:Transcript_14923/g.34498  ORF Transcript_14923/g.34498 Transcript_14923/m.34498 type:complete len:186 (-) Transcript_14923:642-1199(-)
MNRAIFQRLHPKLCLITARFGRFQAVGTCLQGPACGDIISTRAFSDNRSSRPDPLARRPNKICDPYGQGGKPLSLQEIEPLMATLEEGWKLVEGEEAPAALSREFQHSDYITGAKFVSTIAAVGHLNNHFPSVTLKRRLRRREKAWEFITIVECQTPTLGGLSHNDFHLAMVSRENQMKYEHTSP